jgi:hypothetical protein
MKGRESDKSQVIAAAKYDTPFNLYRTKVTFAVTQVKV